MIILLYYNPLLTIVNTDIIVYNTQCNTTAIGENVDCYLDILINVNKKTHFR